MRTCTRCGSPLGEFDAGGDGICQNCEASSGHGSGSSTDVPCQRCGMYLPPHELRMWNSRLYCAYCIMDIQDEENYGKHGHRGGAGAGAAPGADGVLPGGGASSGVCERCGRQSNSLYSLGGRRLCQQCQSEEGGVAGAASFLSQLVLMVKEKFNSVSKPQAKGGFSGPQGQKQTAPIAQRGKDDVRPKQVFDIRNRQMQYKRPAIEDQKPISEKRQRERKPSAHSKESFFHLHSSGKAGKGRGAPKKGKRAR